jgi:tetratricopeptide (TPR) repeat protein
MVSEGLLEPWSDRDITGGAEWAGKIDENLNAAHLIVLLVSPDFLASKYCQDVEMTRALERHDRGEARVVPIILRPCDWETSRFARLQAYPTDGKPVVDWTTQDHGFLNVVNGLRRVVDEICGTAKIVRVGRMEVAVPKFGLKLGMLAAALVAVLAAGTWVWSSAYSSALAEGERWLDIGRFDKAEQPLQRAIRLNPLSGRASAGKAACEVNKSRADPAEFDRRLAPLLTTYPNNAFLRMLRGDQFNSGAQLDSAKQAYQQAVRLRPSLADAWWRLGVVSSLEREYDAAIKQLEKARDLSPESARYQDALAGAYFQSGDLPTSLDLYEVVAQRGSPIAAIEAEKIHRLQDDIPAAEQDGRIAQDKLLASLPEYQVPWQVYRDENHVETLTTPQEKKCYADAEFSATLWLSQKTSESRQHLAHARESCESRWRIIQDAVLWELTKVAEQHSGRAAAIQEYRKLLEE